MTTDIAIDRLGEVANRHPGLLHRGRYLDTSFLLEVGARSWIVRIHQGRVEAVVPGPFVMPRWDFALRASEHEWSMFWQELPPPGHHDLMAMIKRRALRLEGDVRPFMGNLFYFKALLASLRPSGRLDSVAPLVTVMDAVEAGR
ncbi:MAG: hypothetical protein OZ935_14860 [Pseudomonadota bacterium]|nr:hypothetical protein [Pseudomonadota bacterium]